MDQLTDHPSLLRSKFGKYEVIARLGKGGMGLVHLAVARGLGGFHKLVVLKHLDSSDESFRRMFLDEARLAAMLHHPNVVDTYEVSETDGAYFIAMEYLEGQSLDKIIREMRKVGRALEPPFCARVLADALSGLHYTHELSDYARAPLNIVHRDVSPHNLFLTYEGQVKVLDFGVAQTAIKLAETEVGILKGKLAYMAPEQAAAEPVDRRADVYAVGAVLWELLTLQRLRAGDSAAGVLNEAIYGSVPELDKARPGLGRQLDVILSRALARSPRRRYQSAQEMRDALLDYLALNPCSQEDLADFMQARFRELRAKMQRQVAECMHSADTQDPVISVTHEEDGALGLLGELGLGDRQLPILDSGSLSLSSEDATTPLAPGAMLPANLPPVPSIEASGAARSRSINFAEETGAGSAGPQRLLPWALLAAGALTAWLLLRPSEAAPVATKTRGESTAPKPASPILKLHGSNTIGQELVPKLAEAFLKKRGLVGIATTASGEQSSISGRGSEDGKEQSIEVRAHGSSTAFADLASGNCDIGLSSRRIKPEEAKQLQASGLGDLESPAGEHVVGLDGIAVIVHPNSLLERIDLASLRRVFAGEVGDFKGVGAARGAIQLYARDDRSGTFDTFKHLVLGDLPLAGDAQRFSDSAELSGAVARDPQGMGFIGIPYVRSAKALAVGEAGAALLYPSSFTVATEGYALSRRLYLYLPVHNVRALAVEFVNFALSREGQDVVKASGFIDLTPHAIEVGPCQRCPARYARLARTAKRLSLDFRFRTGSAELDSRGLRDLDRLLAFLRESNRSRVTLVGFSDGHGSRQQNVKLALERAQAVAARLRERGVPAIDLEAIGDELPVASNETESGREKNRRVEVWLP